MEQNLATLNLPKSTITEIQRIGYNNISDVEPSTMREKLGLKVNISSLTKAPNTTTALEIYSHELLIGCILTYNERLDYILNDVIVPNAITEFAGESGSGKTQVCFQLCISVQLPKWCGGMESEAVYIDTNNNFASHRVAELATGFLKKYNSIKPAVKVQNMEFDNSTILKHIHYTKICSVTELMACFKYLENNMPGKQVRLIVIDSLSFIVRMIDNKDRKMLINKIFSDLRNLSSKHNLAVVITNDLTTRVNKGESYFTPSFGDSFYHLLNTRILLSKKDEIFHAKLEKNILHGQKETTFYL